MAGNLKIKQELIKILDERILICDGAMGTTLQSFGYKGSNDLLNLHPESLKDITDIHLKYIEAGSDIIQTNTFGSNALKLEQFGHSIDIEVINKNAIEAAKNAIAIHKEKTKNTKKIFIAGDIGPSGKLLEPYGDTKYQTIVDSFSKQIEYLAKYGVELLIIETIIDINEALAALEAVKKINPDVLTACTLSFKENGITAMGNKAEDFGKIILDAGADIIGANCSVGSDSMIKITEKIRNANPAARLLIQPNAGLPSLTDGKTIFNESPEIMAENFRQILKYSPSIVGACCGSTPEHIRKIAELIKN
ncbi:MAG: 5-methyltetrahydrofolate--homocysteine methyltransferase [Actinobacteria bacterium]|nr:5-methyltetrahydrofolate--homocysteine methyltransferase [Actinomycetota bacterium]